MTNETAGIRLLWESESSANWSVMCKCIDVDSTATLTVTSG